MSANVISQGSVRFGVFRFDLATRKLYKNNLQIKLSGQSLRILELLLQRPREIVSREELIADLWSESIHVNFDNSLNTAIKNLRAALRDTAENPLFIETVPLRGYRFIAPVEVQADDVSSEHIPPASEKPPNRRKHKTKILAAVIMGSIAIIFGLGITKFFTRSKSDSTKGGPIAVRRSIAIIGFKNLSRRVDQDWISVLLAEELTAELAVTEEMRTIPGESVSRMKRDLPLPDTDTYAKDTLTRVREYLGTDYVVLGSYFASGKSSARDIRVDVRLQDALTGETVTSLSEKATEAELPDLVSRVGTALRQELGLTGLSPVQTGFVRALLPSNLEAVRLYSDGLTKLRALEMPRARDLLEKAIAAEPSFPLSHLALGESWSALGFRQKAKKEATQALHLSTYLSRQDQLFVQAFYFEMNDDWPNAIQMYQALFSFFPDNLEYGLRLARAQSTAGKGKDALVTIETLRQLPLPMREDPRIDLAEALAAKSLGDYKHERAAAASAGTKATAQGARLGVAEAKLEEGGALDDLGQPKAAVELEGEAKTIFAAVGDQGGVARALNDIGRATLHEGNLVAAERMFAESAELAGQVGNKLLLAQSLNNTAIVRYQQGNLAESARISQQAADYFREIGDRNAVATSLNNIAVVRTDLGDLSLAKEKYEESLAITRETGDSASLARTLANLARLLVREGNLQGAKQRYKEASTVVSIGREHTYAVQGLGDVFFWQGDLNGAEKQYEEALQLRSQIGDHELVAESRMMIAQVLVEKGSFRKAQEYAQEAVDEFRKAGNGDEEAEAEAILALAFMGQAMPSKAQDTIKQATSLAAKSEDHDVHLSVGIDSARVSVDTGDIQAAVVQLQAAISEANKYHYRGYELEARLRLGEIELRGRDSLKGRTLLGVLAKEATAEAFGLIADAANKDLKERARQ